MILSHKLPIIKKAFQLKHGYIKPLSPYHYACLSFIIPHGSTDIWMYPVKKCMFNYGSSFAFFMFQPIRVKYFFLFLYSIFHIKNDISAPIVAQLVYSLGLHASWIWFPEWAITYLALIHSVLHYTKVIPLLNKGQIITLACTQLFVCMLIRSYETKDLSFGGTWIPVVIGHIMTNA